MFKNWRYSQTNTPNVTITIAYLLLSLSVEEFWNSFYVSRSYYRNLAAYFLDHPIVGDNDAAANELCWLRSLWSNDVSERLIDL